MAQKRTVEQKLSGIQSHLNEVNDEINQLSSDSRDTILEAIKKQRWYSNICLTGKKNSLLSITDGRLFSIHGSSKNRQK